MLSRKICKLCHKNNTSGVDGGCKDGWDFVSDCFWFIKGVIHCEALLFRKINVKGEIPKECFFEVEQILVDQKCN